MSQMKDNISSSDLDRWYHDLNTFFMSEMHGAGEGDLSDVERVRDEIYAKMRG